MLEQGSTSDISDLKRMIEAQLKSLDSENLYESIQKAFVSGSLKSISYSEQPKMRTVDSFKRADSFQQSISPEPVPRTGFVERNFYQRQTIESDRPPAW